MIFGETLINAFRFTTTLQTESAWSDMNITGREC